MAVSVGRLAQTINGITPHFSETFISASKNPLLQTAKANHVLRRARSANPEGWSRSSKIAKKVPLDMQHGGMSPSSGYLSSMVQGPLEKKAMEQSTSSKQAINAVKLNLYDKLNYSSKSSPKKCKVPSRPLSLERMSFAKFSKGYKLNRQTDREDELYEATDRIPANPPSNMNAAGSSAENRVLKKTDKATRAEEGVKFVKGESSLQRDEGVVKTTSHELSSDTRGECVEDGLSPDKDISPKESQAILAGANETPEQLAESGEEKLSQNAEEEILSKIQENTMPKKNEDWSTSLQRTVDINLNDLNSTSSESNKKLSMDINVVVRVKSREALDKPEIGFQELTGLKHDNELEKEKGTVSQEEMDKFFVNNETAILSQKDLTEEIGKVYNFLKNNEQLEISTTNSFDIFQNFDKIKNLYFNALKCVKAFKELRKNQTASDHSSSESEEGNCINEKCNSSSVVPVIKYPIAFERVEHSDQRNQYKEMGEGSMGQSKQFLGGKLPGMMSVRMYSSAQKSDCEKAKKLPCLQSSELSKGGEKAAAKSVCERLCMPCCKPARDPPLCFYPYHKSPCKKERAPRPAFSECKQIFELRQVVPCECVRPRATSCKKAADSESCDKR